MLSALLALAVLSLVPRLVNLIERVAKPSNANGAGPRVIVPPGSRTDSHNDDPR
ncbi:hypothetical protein FQZ97_1279870 [compost metagenome]